jgi:hypothetical protein
MFFDIKISDDVSFSYDTWCYITVYRLRKNMENTLLKIINLCHSVTGWTVRGSNPGGDMFNPTRQDRHWDPPSLPSNGNWVFPGDKSAGVWP